MNTVQIKITLASYKVFICITDTAQYNNETQVSGYEVVYSYLTTVVSIIFRKNYQNG